MPRNKPSHTLHYFWTFYLGLEYSDDLSTTALTHWETSADHSEPKEQYILVHSKRTYFLIYVEVISNEINKLYELTRTSWNMNVLPVFINMERKRGKVKEDINWEIPIMKSDNKVGGKDFTCRNVAFKNNAWVKSSILLHCKYVHYIEFTNLL